MNLMWIRVFSFSILILMIFTGSIYAEDRILLTYKDSYLIKNMDITKMIYNFLLHFNIPIDIVKFDNLSTTLLYKYKYIIITATGTLPGTIEKELPHLQNSKICIIGKEDNLKSIPYEDEEKGFLYIKYKGKRYFVSPNKLVYKYKTEDRETKVLATISNEAQDIPFLLKNKNLYILGGFPLWDEEAYFFANFLYDFLDVPYIKKGPKLLLIIQDINPYTKPENLKDTVKILERERIPFVVSYYPLFFDTDRKTFVSMKERETLSYFLNILAKRDIPFILSGLLRKYYREETERDAEFWDIKNDHPIDNFENYFNTRISMAFTLSKKIGIFPVGFMPSEFAFPPKYMGLVGKYFDYYIGTIQLSDYTYKSTQSLPYIIKDPNKDLFFITPNLGYISKENPSLSLSSIIERAKKLRYVKDAFGVVYFHPFIDKKYLKILIDELIQLGYEFSGLPYLRETSKKEGNIKYMKRIKYSALYLKEEHREIKKIGRVTGIFFFGISIFFVLLGLIVYLFTTRKKYKELFKIILIVLAFSSLFSINAYGKTAIVVGEKKSDVIMIANLLGHFKLDIKTYLVEDIDKKGAEDVDILFFISNNDHVLPKKIVEIFTTRKKELCFIGQDPEAIIKQGVYPLTYIGITKDFPYLEYKDTTVFNEWEMYVPEIKIKEGKAYGYFSNLKDKIPAYIKTKNLWIITGSPFYSFTGIAFSDLLHDIIGENHRGIPKALIRIEDINPDYPLKILKETTDYLIKKNLPFAMAFYPVYMNFALKESVTLERRPKMIKYLRELDTHRGRIIMHGITHQYSKEEISGEGSEFWDMIHNRSIPNFKEYFEKRISYGISTFKRLNIPFYAFEPPHYNLSLEGQEELKKYIPNYVGQIMVDDPETTQEFYYPIYKSYAGLYIIPENLGYVEKEDPKESIERILYKARIIKKMVRDPFAGFFFHPFMGVDYLKPIVKGLAEMGYYFVDLKKEVPPLEIPEVKEVKIEDLNLPFYYKERKGFKLSTKTFSIIAFLSVLLLILLYISKRRKKY